MRRWTLTVVFAVASAACATVAGIDVQRAADAGGSDASDEIVDRDPEAAAPVVDAGADAIEEDAPPSSGSCTCLVLACTHASTDGRDCCWNADGGLSATSYGPGCAPGRAACATDDDCKIYGGTCQKLSCAGANVGICATSAPSGNVCP